jgi:hypothetical protein
LGPSTHTWWWWALLGAQLPSGLCRCRRHNTPADTPPTAHHT